MKNYILILSMLMLTTTAFSQTKTHRLGITVGGGQQDYIGDLGNGFKVHSKDDVWRGAVVFQAGYYLNRSFDISMFGSVGDYGYCQPEDVANTEIDPDQRCPGCGERVGLGNLNSRFSALGISFKYKFANGYLLKEKSKWQPYIFIGSAINKVVDRMEMNCVAAGNYTSINTGAGVRYYLTSRINLGYQISMGYFTSDGVDRMSHGSNDKYIQNVLMLGIDLF